jgi:hypothetical protein
MNGTKNLYWLQTKYPLLKNGTVYGKRKRPYVSCTICKVQDEEGVSKCSKKEVVPLTNGLSKAGKTHNSLSIIWNRRYIKLQPKQLKQHGCVGIWLAYVRKNSVFRRCTKSPHCSMCRRVQWLLETHTAWSWLYWPGTHENYNGPQFRQTLHGFCWIKHVVGMVYIYLPRRRQRSYVISQMGWLGPYTKSNPSGQEKESTVISTQYIKLNLTYDRPK